MNAPCYKCKVRSVGCHAKCEAYKTYSKSVKSEVRTIYEEREVRKQRNIPLSNGIDSKLN